MESELDIVVSMQDDASDQLASLSDQLDQLQGSSDNASSSVDNTGESLDSTATSADDMGSSAGNAGNSVVSMAAGFALGQIGVQGLEGAFNDLVDSVEGAVENIDQIEQSANALGVYDSNAKEVASTMSQLKAISESSTLSFSDLAAGAVNLQNMGVQSANVVPIMTTLSKVATVFGGNVDSLASKFGIMADKGDLSESSFTRLLKAGMNVNAMIAEAINNGEIQVSWMKEGAATTQNVTDALTTSLGKQKISFADLATAVGNTTVLNKAYTEDNKTLSNQIQIVKNDINDQIEAWLGLSATGVIIKGSFMDQLTNGFGEMVTGIKDTISTITDFFEHTTTGQLILKMFGTIINQIGNEFKQLGVAIAPLMPYIKELGELIGVVFGAAAYGFLTFIKAMVQGLTTLYDLVDGIIKLFTSFNNMVGSVGKNIGNFGSAIGKDLHIPGFASGVQNFSGGMAVVGENGPELVNLPAGSSVIPNSGTNGVQVSINIYGNVGSSNGTGDLTDLGSQIGSMLQRSGVGIV